MSPRGTARAVRPGTIPRQRVTSARGAPSRGVSGRGVARPADRARLVGRAAALALAAGTLLPSPAGGQESGAEPSERIRGATLSVRVERDAPVGVELRYDLTLEPGTRELPLRGIAFRGAVPERMTATAGGAPAPVRMDAAAPPLVSGTVEIPAGSVADGTLSLGLLYQIPRPFRSEEDRFDLAVPIPIPDRPPVGAPERLFVAEVRLPPGFSLVERFPTVPVVQRMDDEVRVYELSLPVVPSLLRVRARSGPPPLVTFGQAVDIGVIGALLILGLVGWRLFRRSA